MNTTITTLSGFFDWFNACSQSESFEVKQIPFALLEHWDFDQNTGNLRHESGKFFSIEGLSVASNFYYQKRWNQLIINQPEQGILGIISRKTKQGREFLMQAKMEPGNVNLVQLSPTVQATKSNYTQVHKGKLPAYLAYFLEPEKHQARVIFDLLQPEQGARFYQKQNRNILLEISKEIELEEGFIWVSLKLLKELLKKDNIVNMDARTVISCISDEPLRASTDRIEEIKTWLKNLETKYYLNSKLISLSQVKDWQKDEFEFFHKSRKYFSLIAVAVKAKNREVLQWTQPLFKDAGIGLIGFLHHAGKYLVQAKIESGNRSCFDLAPTVSFSNYEERSRLEASAPLMEYFLNAPKGKIIYDTILSEEGGRFYQAQNRYMIVDADPAYVPPQFQWMSLKELQYFVQQSLFNVEARSLIATL